MRLSGVLVASGAAAVVGLICYTLKKGWRLEWHVVGSGTLKHVGVVSALHVYPIKSCQGCEVDEIELDVYGATRDRRFMVVDENGRFITQRQEASMCHIRAEHMLDGSMSLSLAGQPTAEQCCFKPVSVASATHKQMEVGVWDDEVMAVDQGDVVGAWLSAVLGRPARLVGMTSSFNRPTSRKYTPQSVQGQTSFSDGFPLLMISEKSLEDLNSRLSTPVPMNRFRPNIVVKECNAYDEDKWRTIIIRDLRCHVVKPCSRCKITTTDQETGYRGEEPLATLSSYRLKQHVSAGCGDKNDVFFGQNICHEGKGSVAVGDKVWARYWVYPGILRPFSHFY